MKRRSTTPSSSSSKRTKPAQPPPDLLPPPAPPAPTAPTASEVYRIVRLIPEGSVFSYGDVAKSLGFPTHSRKVGAILSLLPPTLSSPFHPQPPRLLPASPPPEGEVEEEEVPLNPNWVPWHRVVSSTGVISPRPNERGMERQKDWLRNEGVEVTDSEVNGVGGKVKMATFRWGGP